MPPRANRRLPLLQMAPDAVRVRLDQRQCQLGHWTAQAMSQRAPHPATRRPHARQTHPAARRPRARWTPPRNPQMPPRNPQLNRAARDFPRCPRSSPRHVLLSVRPLRTRTANSPGRAGSFLRFPARFPPWESRRAGFRCLRASRAARERLRPRVDVLDQPHGGALPDCRLYVHGVHEALHHGKAHA